ncbi:PDZ domain-containing protein [Nitriliruptoraceae bacterium ZYF776]|nr:PDZ domain-containing protein [Profundirhabdus halotolerans]
MDTDTLPPPPAGTTLPPPPPAPVPTGPGRGRTAVVAAAVAAFVATGVAVPVTLAVAGDGAEDAVSTPNATTVASDGATRTVADIAAEVGPSVALVSVTGTQGQGSGSAVIYREDGYLVTNAHVVAGASEVRVTLPDGTVETAEVVGADATSDLAVLRIDADDLPVPTYAEGAPSVGDSAIAIGSPFGLEGSVTTGIVSATGRSVPTEGAPLVDLLQTDAAINPGNSGGALVDGSGAVIGINTAILSASGTSSGIGFAIPTDTVRAVADQLIDTGSVQHAFLGVQGETVDPEVAARYGLEADRGAVIVAVEPDGPAATAGLEPGDIVTAVDGNGVASMPELAGRIQSLRPGDAVELTVVRDGEERTLTAELVERPSDTTSAPAPEQVPRP